VLKNGKHTHTEVCSHEWLVQQQYADERKVQLQGHYAFRDVGKPLKTSVDVLQTLYVRIANLYVICC